MAKKIDWPEYVGCDVSDDPTILTLSIEQKESMAFTIESALLLTNAIRLCYDWKDGMEYELLSSLEDQLREIKTWLTLGCQ